jgi:hypothetical protein
MNSSSFAGRRLTLTLADDRIRVPAGIQPGERFGDGGIVRIGRGSAFRRTIGSSVEALPPAI